jgi:hypothetical protein
MAGHDNEATAARQGDRGHLRASHGDRDRVIATLKDAFVHGRLTSAELGERAGQVYASRTYAELAEVTADIPVPPVPARSPRDPWRATKIVGWIEYAVIVPGIFSLMALKGPGTTEATVIIVPTVTYLVFWALGLMVMIASRSAKRGGSGDDATGR